VKVKVGMFKEEFDLRFDELRDTMVTKNMVTTVSTLLPEMRKYYKDHPDQIREPKSKHKEEL